MRVVREEKSENGSDGDFMSFPIARLYALGLHYTRRHSSMLEREWSSTSFEE